MNSSSRARSGEYIRRGKSRPSSSTNSRINCGMARLLAFGEIDESHLEALSGDYLLPVDKVGPSRYVALRGLSELPMLPFAILGL